MGKKKDKNKKKTGLPSPMVIRLKELVLPTMISLALLSSLLLIFATVRKDGDEANDESTVITTEDLENLIAESTEDLTGGITELQIKILEEGTGGESKVGDTISVHYTGRLINGTVFDSSIPRGEPYELTLGVSSVIQGWQQGIPGMKVGEKRELKIPYSLGYGESGSQSIPGKATLIFEVELLEIK